MTLPETDTAVYMTDGGDGVELGEVYDPRTPPSLRWAARRALHRLIIEAQS